MKVIFVPGRRKIKLTKPVLAIGVFDGVHNGHRFLLRRVLSRAKRVGGQSVVLTFDPHPARVLHPDKEIKLLGTLPERLKLFGDLGIDVCFVVKFTREFSLLTPQQFINEFLLPWIQPHEIFVGDDFRFGHHRRGHLDFLREEGLRRGFKTHIVKSVHSGRLDISSSAIRGLLAAGSLGKAQRMLGRNYSITGTVVRGNSRGRTLGFPTANIRWVGDLLIGRGVYLTNLVINEKSYPSLTNVGFRPTFSKMASRATVETHVLGFNQNIYRQKVILEFIKKIRDEKKFDSIPYLREQLCQDREIARRFFR